MARAYVRLLCSLLMAVSLLCTARPAQAQFNLGNIGPTKGQVIGVAVGAVAAVAVVGVVIYLAVRQPRVTGCVLSAANGGLALQGTAPGDPVYLLANAPPTLQVGQRVKVIGHKNKKAAPGGRVLTVSNVAKVYGPCSPVVAHALLDPGPAAIPAATPR